MKKAKSKNESQQPEINKYIPSIPLKKIPSEKALQILRKAGHDVNEEQSEERGGEGRERSAALSHRPRHHHWNPLCIWIS